MKLQKRRKGNNLLTRKIFLFSFENARDLVSFFFKLLLKLLQETTLWVNIGLFFVILTLISQRISKARLNLNSANYICRPLPKMTFFLMLAKINELPPADVPPQVGNGQKRICLLHKRVRNGSWFIRYWKLIFIYCLYRGKWVWCFF